MSEHVRMVRLSDLQEWDRNPHKHPDSQLQTLASGMRRFGFTSLPVLATYPGERVGFVSSGNGRLAALRLLRSQYPSNPPPGIDLDTDGDWLIPVRPMAYTSKGEAEAQGLSDNWIASMPGVEDDAALLADLLRDLDGQGVSTAGLGLDLDAMAKIADEIIASAAPSERADAAPTDAQDKQEQAKPAQLSDTYTKKIKAPIYEPKGDKPELSALVDKSKTDALVAEIDAAGLPDDVAGFLRQAAQRHASFHYKRIAEYYCHAPKEVQLLMERSALVIIDFDKAIEYGFIHLTERLGALADAQGFKTAEVDDAS